ncbi:peptidylprolyl isomerase [Paenibacillus yonginensis]|uniref:Peptidyl-prolyl cis-trans isomerase n=1 Tax=Paenibacillus yonginensis TaxID=1462996 RepID=A0A1B1MW36_9BACL|nr:peptidylprolyl isomerase [Paenibacillus yonginensis]ANS73379.1 peptidylprolyl isomerase [Paenibacillus yonginensis]
MKRRNLFTPALLALMLVFVFALTACGNKPEASNAGNSTQTSGSNASGNAGDSADSSEAPSSEAPASTGPVADDPSKEVQPDPAFTSTDNPVVTIEMKTGNQIQIELYPKAAPNTVNNFISLVQKGFYDGTKFHRVIPGFMIQGGDPQGNGTGGPGYSIAGEFTTNGVKNDLKHTRGVISMARAQDPNSGGSQFFIMVADADYLDGQYAAFGKVIKGMSTVDAIVNLPRDSNDMPADNDLDVMSKVTVDTKGKTYPEPEKVGSN